MTHKVQNLWFTPYIKFLLTLRQELRFGQIKLIIGLKPVCSIVSEALDFEPNRQA